MRLELRHQPKCYRQRSNTVWYHVWRAHFDQTAGSGAGAIANAAVPEPSTLALLIVGICKIKVIVIHAIPADTWLPFWREESDSQTKDLSRCNRRDFGIFRVAYSSW